LQNTLITTLTSEIVLYAVQFLLLPLIYPAVLGRGNEGAVALLLTTTFITAASVIIFSGKIKYWLLSFPAYVLLLFLYTPARAYGIGIVGLDLDGLASRYDHSERIFGIVVVVVIVFFIQLLTYAIIKAVKILKN
jgi:hypothetical protein